MTNGETQATSTGLRTLEERMRLAALDPVLTSRLAMVNATVVVRGSDDDVGGLLLRFGAEGLAVGGTPAGSEPDVCLWMEPDLLAAAHPTARTADVRHLASPQAAVVVGGRLRARRFSWHREAFDRWCRGNGWAHAQPACSAGAP